MFGSHRSVTWLVSVLHGPAGALRPNEECMMLGQTWDVSVSACRLARHPSDPRNTMTREPRPKILWFRTRSLLVGEYLLFRGIWEAVKVELYWCLTICISLSATSEIKGEKYKLLSCSIQNHVRDTMFTSWGGKQSHCLGKRAITWAIHHLQPYIPTMI